MIFKKVVVGISGGVDSAIAALMLKQKGFDVCGVFMKNWDENETGYCTGNKDYQDAQIICRKIDIPLVEVNFVKDYWNNVFLNFLEDYEAGITPNPDILCNRHIKFQQFYKYAINNLNADAIATGHYAKSSFGNFLEHYDKNNDIKLLCATDNFKDQTFFLSNVRQESLRKTMFPIGNYKKWEIKEIAKRYDLKNIAAKKESTGICFIGNRNFKKFITEYLYPKPGNFIDIDSGKIVGKHNGIHLWTIGQRCRISGCLKPYFTVKKILETNEIFVAAGTDHHSLYSNIVYTGKPHWIRKFNFDNNFWCKFRFQHTKPLTECRLSITNNGLIIYLTKPLRAITPGQYAVFYLYDECLGSSRIINCEMISDLSDVKNELANS